MAENYHVYIDRQTGTWGMERDLVTAEIPESQVDDMETMSDTQLIQLAYQWEDAQRQPQPQSRFTEEERRVLQAQNKALTNALLRKKGKK
jgi:hypothetical protein